MTSKQHGHGITLVSAAQRAVDRTPSYQHEKPVQPVSRPLHTTCYMHCELLSRVLCVRAPSLGRASNMVSKHLEQVPK